MRIVLHLALLLAILGAAAPTAIATRAQAAPLVPLPQGCVQPTQALPHGALWMHCIPAGWQGDLVVYAHGYVADLPANPLDFYYLTFAGVSLPQLVQGQGYAFATTSYRQNGLAVLEGVEDMRELIAAFPGAAGRAPRRVYVIGVSEGGLVAALLAERSPQLISGALAACGPIGDFKRQTEYFGDFRVLFDYFFPGVLPTSPISIPTGLIDDWESTYAPAVAAAVSSNPISATQLISTTQAAIDPNSRASTTLTTTLGVLWYNVFATNDATQKLGGNPYGNSTRVYTGSLDDDGLNQPGGVERFTASASALSNLAAYETSGDLRAPLVTLHTTGDEIIPFWHTARYRDKVPASLQRNLRQIAVERYGHCAFGPFEALAAFSELVAAVDNRYAVYLPRVLLP